MIKLLMKMVGASSLLVGCATYEALPEQLRLATLAATPPDYTAFEERRQKDAQTFRSLTGRDGSRELSVALSELRTDTLPVAGDSLLYRELETLHKSLQPEELSNTPKSKFFITQNWESIDARALNTGNIVLQAGVLRDLKNYDEVNFILAHETAHILLDHFRSDQVENAAQIATGLAYMAAIYADQSRNKTHYSAGGNSSGEMNTATLAVASVGMAIEYFAERRRDQQEVEADQLGLELLFGADIANSRRGPDSVLAQQVSFAADRVATAEASVKAVEVQFEERCGPRGNFFGRMLSDTLAASAGLPVNEERSQICQLWDIGVYPNRGVIQKAKAAQEKIQQRKDLLKSYDEQHYGAVRVDPAMTPILTKDGQNVGLAQAISPNGPTVRLGEVERARTLLQAGNCQAALTYATGKLRFRNDPFGPLRHVLFDAARAPACDMPDAGIHVKIAHDNGARASGDLLMQAYGYYLGRDENAKALEMVGFYADKTGEREAVMPQQIPLLVELDRLDEAKAVLEACRTLDPANRSLTQQCETAFEVATAPPPEEAPGAAPRDSRALEANITLATTGLSHRVIQQAMWDPAIQAMMPVGTDYVFYIPTDMALARLVDGDPFELLRFENRARLKAIIKGQIVVREATPVAGPIIQPAGTATGTGTGADMAPPAAYGHVDGVGLNRFEQYVAQTRGMIYGIGFEGTDGSAWLTDTVFHHAP